MSRSLTLALRGAVMVAVFGAIGLVSSHPRASATDASVRTARVAADGPKTKYGTELPALRTRSSRTYVAPHGSFVDVISAGAVNYKDSAGQWQPIDDSLVPGQSGTHVNKADAYQVSLPDQIEAAPIRIAFGGAFVTQQIEGASGAGVVDGNAETYSSVLPSTDLTYATTSSGLKETLTFANASIPQTYVIDLAVSSGLSLKLARQGALQVLNQQGQTVAEVPAPSMVDAAGKESRDVQVALTDGGNGTYKLSVTPSRSWLTDSKRAYPVKLDPSTTFGFDSQDCFINSATPTTSYCGTGTNLDVGRDANGESRALLYWDLAADGIPTDAVMLDVNLQLNLQSESNTTPISVSGYRMMTNWISPPSDTQDTTWNDAYGGNAWSTPGGDFKTPPTTTRPTMAGDSRARATTGGSPSSHSTGTSATCRTSGSC